MNSPQEETEFDPFAHDAKKSGSSGAAIAWLALLITVAIAGFLVWQWWAERSAPNTDMALAQRLGQIQTEQVSLQQSVSAINARARDTQQQALPAGLQSLPDEVQKLNARLEEIRQQAGADEALANATHTALQTLDQRIKALESGMAEVLLRRQSPQKQMGLAEVDGLLRMASERLSLFRDVAGAGQAMRLADQQLAALDDPMLLPVRQSIADAQVALQAVPVVDVLALSARIDALQADIPGLGFPSQVGTAPAVVAETENLSVWARIKNAIRPLVTVRRRVPDESLLSLQDKEYLRQAMWLQGETARMALMRHDQSAWTGSLQRLDQQLEQYFDPASATVARARQDVADLLAVTLLADLPSIDAAWQQLQRLRGLNDIASSKLPVRPKQAPAASAAVAPSETTTASSVQNDIPSTPSDQQAEAASATTPAEPDSAQGEAEAVPDEGQSTDDQSAADQSDEGQSDEDQDDDSGQGDGGG